MGKAHIRALFEEQIPRLRRYARALLRNREDADDLVQDCLERAWTRSHRWKPDTDLRAWLFTIMHNLYVNTIRRSQRHHMRTLEDVREPADPTLSGQERANGIRDLEKGLATLPPDQREVLLMICLEELSYQQVAEILAVPVGTVMSRLHRARERMRRWMREQQPAALRSVK
jgi:RNA polymerase sigma-70 factor (ECF subfamily)